MTGSSYTRQSAANIAAGQPVTSAPVNNEFNQLVAFASGTTGHDHTGATGVGPQLTPGAFAALSGTSTGIIAAASSTSFNAVTITGTVNQVTVTNGNGVSGNPTLSLPANVVTGSYSVNGSTIPANGIYLPSANFPTVSANSLPVAGFASEASAVDYFIIQNASTGNPAVLSIGAAGSDTNIAIEIIPKGTGTVQIPLIACIGGAIDNTVIGASTPAAGYFAALSASGGLNISGGDSVLVNGNSYAQKDYSGTSRRLIAFDGASTNNIDIGGSSGGGINFFTNGSQHASIDTSGNLVTSGTTTSSGFIGPLTGNVTGNVSGTSANVTGTVAVINGGTGAITASGARSNLSAAASGTNTDITSLNSPALGAATATTQTAGTSNTTVATTAFVSAALQAAHPVGCVYISTSSTNPGTTFGFGTWVAFAQGTVMIGVGTGTDINSNTLNVTGGATGGEYIHTLTTPEIPSHNHSDLGHVHSNIPTGQGQSGVGAVQPTGATTNPNAGSFATTTGYANIQNTGGGGAHNNIQPYIGVYIWNRTA